MNFLLSQSPHKILMPDVQNGLIKTLQIQLAMRLTLSYYEQDISNL